jgi:phage terminase large subunit
MASVQIALPEKLIPVFDGPADVRGAYGGRGSAKTRSFAKMMAVRGYMYGQEGISGLLVCARLFMNSLDESSLEEVKRAIQDEPFLAEYYDVGEKYVASKDGRIAFAFSGLDRNIASIKSKGRILICWVDEAEPVGDVAWETLIPTLREEGDGWNAELWVTWNPLRKNAAVERRFRMASDPLIKMVELNWRDNPRFPAKLERDRQRDMLENEDQYDHIWEGGYVQAVSGAYYAKGLSAAKTEHRICRLLSDPLMTLRAYWDIGGTGAKADACAIWITQIIGKEARALDYYEAVGQPLSTHVQWLRSQGYEKALCILPHDGANHDKVFKVSYESSLRDAGFEVRVIPNMGAGAANRRIEAVRRMLPNAWFDETKTQAGRDALGWYHEKRDDNRQIGLGPKHDWSSHGADAYGLFAVDYADQPSSAPVDLHFTSQFSREPLFGQRADLFGA